MFLIKPSSGEKNKFGHFLVVIQLIQTDAARFFFFPLLVPDDGAAERAERRAGRLHGRHVRRREQVDLGLRRRGDTTVAAGICNTISERCRLSRCHKGQDLRNLRRRGIFGADRNSLRLRWSSYLFMYKAKSTKNPP